MGTRGAYGFYKNGIDKITYNHFDSYPEGLGANIVEFIETTPLDEINEIFNRIIIVRKDDVPTPEQIEECKEYFDVPILQGEGIDWYTLLRPVQGNLIPYRKGLRYMTDAKDFLKHSLWCEWAYVINLDTNELEIYRGFQRTPQRNRYYTEENEDGYYNVALVVTFPLLYIPTSWMDIVKYKLTHPF